LEKSPVLAVNKMISRSMFVTLDKRLFPNLVPFRVGDTHGVTSCMLGADLPMDSVDDHRLGASDYYNIVRNYQRQLRLWFPTAWDEISSDDTQKYLYTCQKVSLRPLAKSRQPARKFIVIDHSIPEWGGLERLFTFYPGKFTAAPMGAEDCATKVQRALGSSIPAIAVQPYFSETERDYPFGRAEGGAQLYEGDSVPARFAGR
jgi:hypothetical protein